MSLKFKYWLFVSIIHILLIIIVYELLKSNKWLFIFSELGIMVSLYLAFLLHKAFVKPIDTMQSGINAIVANDYNTRFLKTGSADIDKLILVFNNMLDQLRAERVRSESQGYFLEKLIEISPIGMIIMDFDDQITEANSMAIKIAELAVDWMGRDIKSIESPLIKKINQLNLGMPTVISISSLKRYKCQITTVVHKGFKRKCILIEDLSAEILETEKKAYGKVIRMMSHEVNNSMGAVNSILQSVLEFGFKEDQVDESLKESIEVAIDRNESLGTFVKNFAEVVRLPPPQLELYDLNDIVNRALRIFSRKAASQNIIVIEKLCENPIKLLIDKVQMEQVVINILKNSLEAIGSAKDGTIEIATQNRAPQLTLTDNGSGITDKEKLFTPFYSSKPTGQGIGLMIIREILSNHHCTFELATDPETQLTQFKISF